MGGDSLHIGGNSELQQSSVETGVPQKTVGLQKDAVLVPTAMREVMTQTGPPEGRIDPPVEKLAAINIQSTLLGEDRIGDKTELDASLALHADATLDAKNPPHLDAEGKSVLDVTIGAEVNALVDKALARLEDPACNATHDAAKETAQILEKAIAALDVHDLDLAPLHLTLEDSLRRTQLTVESHAGLPPNWQKS